MVAKKIAYSINREIFCVSKLLIWRQKWVAQVLEEAIATLVLSLLLLATKQKT